MANARTNRQVGLKARLRSWLEMPLSEWQCALGWFAATAFFLGIIAVFGGPSITDTPESVYGTWAIAHGQMACAYPPPVGSSTIAPLYLLLAAGIAAVARIGHTAPFPSAATLGPGCDKAVLATNRWSFHAAALNPTTWIGCVGWLALMVGVVAWLRASGRGRSGWEPATLVVVASLPPIWMSVQTAFHPQDLLAMGFALSGLACACRGRWIGAGILVALAVLSQQFAILVAAPLLVLAPANRRISYAVAVLTTGAMVDLPLLAMTAGHALRALTLGTGDDPSTGGTVLWELHLYGVPLVLLSRVAPIALSVALAWWVSHRLGPWALKPAPLISVVAVSLGLRLVFEEHLFGYYFMALVVSLVLVDVVRGHIRSSVIAWLAAVVLVFCQTGFDFVDWAQYPQNLVPVFIVVPAVLVIVLHFLRGGRRSNLLASLAVVGCALITWPGQTDPLSHTIPWLWQVALVVPGIMLAAAPLLADLQRRETEPAPAEGPKILPMVG
jgi:hypothetical protein